MEEFYRPYDHGWVICGCGYDCPLPDPTHISKLFIGYCHRGMRLYPDSKYQCICGKILDSLEEAKRHSSKGYCMEYAEAKKFFTCKVCDIFCHTKSMLKKHETTQRHKNKVEEPLKCKTCDVRCTSKLKYEQHLKTKKHLARLEAPPLELECKLCNIKCLSQKQIKAHLETKKHKKNESKSPSLEES